ncbi:unnamed protein product [Hydatigera taeniaeformis]|uniref:Expressed conserved protein n=1 Tax=Hydatigena taeniaeformis TaxID=6205 RepID=A0A0R3X2H1_HYDTA|nr:unnamed protein product [Hydatigera taeniaeformis]
MDYPKRQFMFRFHENIYKAHDFIFDKKTTRETVPQLCPMIVPSSAPHATFCTAASNDASNSTHSRGYAVSSHTSPWCRKMREEPMSIVKKRLLSLRMYDHIMNKNANQHMQMRPFLSPDAHCRHGWGTVAYGTPVGVLRSPYQYNGRACPCSNGLPMRMEFPVYYTQGPS